MLQARVVCLDTPGYAQLEQPIQDAFGALSIEAIVKEAPVLNALSDNARRDMASSMSITVHKRNDTIMQQGERGEHFYVILAGTCDVHVKKDGGQPGETINVRSERSQSWPPPPRRSVLTSAPSPRPIVPRSSTPPFAARTRCARCGRASTRLSHDDCLLHDCYVTVTGAHAAGGRVHGRDGATE